MSETKQIYKLLSQVSASVGAIGKDRVNEQQRFQFRGVDDVMNALHPALTKHGVVLVPSYELEPIEQRATKSGGAMFVTRVKGTFTFYAPDGSSIVAGPFIGEGSDSGDKSANKAMAAAFKYAMTQTLTIPYIAQDDSDAETPEESRAKAEPVREARPEPKPKKFTMPTFDTLLTCGTGDDGKPVRKRLDDMTDPEFVEAHARATSHARSKDEQTKAYAEAVLDVIFNHMKAARNHLVDKLIPF